MELQKKAYIKENAMGRVLYEIFSELSGNINSEDANLQKQRLFLDVILPGAEEMIRIGGYTISEGIINSGAELKRTYSKKLNNFGTRIGKTTIWKPRDWLKTSYPDLKTLFLKAIQRFKTEEAIESLYGPLWENLAKHLYDLTSLIERFRQVANEGNSVLANKISNDIIIKMNIIDQLNHNTGSFNEHLIRAEQIIYNNNEDWSDWNTIKGIDESIMQIRDVSEMQHPSDKMYILSELLTPESLRRQPELYSFLKDNDFQRILATLPKPDIARAEKDYNSVVEYKNKINYYQDLVNRTDPSIYSLAKLYNEWVDSSGFNDGIIYDLSFYYRAIVENIKSYIKDDLKPIMEQHTELYMLPESFNIEKAPDLLTKIVTVRNVLANEVGMQPIPVPSLSYPMFMEKDYDFYMEDDVSAKIASISHFSNIYNLYSFADVKKNMAIRVLHSAVPMLMKDLSTEREIKDFHEFLSVDLIPGAKEIIELGIKAVIDELYFSNDQKLSEEIKQQLSSGNQNGLYMAADFFLYNFVEGFGGESWSDFCKLLIDLQQQLYITEVSKDPRQALKLSSYLNAVDGMMHNSGLFLEKIIIQEQKYKPQIEMYENPNSIDALLRLRNITRLPQDQALTLLHTYLPYAPKEYKELFKEYRKLHPGKDGDYEAAIKALDKVGRNMLLERLLEEQQLTFIPTTPPVPSKK